MKRRCEKDWRQDPGDEGYGKEGEGDSVD